MSLALSNDKRESLVSCDNILARGTDAEKERGIIATMVIIVKAPIIITFIIIMNNL